MLCTLTLGESLDGRDGLGGRCLRPHCSSSASARSRLQGRSGRYDQRTRTTRIFVLAAAMEYTCLPVDSTMSTCQHGARLTPRVLVLLHCLYVLCQAIVWEELSVLSVQCTCPNSVLQVTSISNYIWPNTLCTHILTDVMWRGVIQSA